MKLGTYIQHKAPGYWQVRWVGLDSRGYEREGSKNFRTEENAMILACEFAEIGTACTVSFWGPDSSASSPLSVKLVAAKPNVYSGIMAVHRGGRPNQKTKHKRRARFPSTQIKA